MLGSGNTSPLLTMRSMFSSSFSVYYPFNPYIMNLYNKHECLFLFVSNNIKICQIFTDAYQDNALTKNTCVQAPGATEGMKFNIGPLYAQSCQLNNLNIAVLLDLVKFCRFAILLITSIACSQVNTHRTS